MNGVRPIALPCRERAAGERARIATLATSRDAGARR
jgi:hypothetical protein